MDAATPRVCDNDRDEITVTLDGKEIRGWSYQDEAERRVKMRAAREFCEGWFQASKRDADLVEALRPFADIGIGTDPGYQPMIRMDREAIVRARAVLDSREPKKEQADV